VSGPSDLLVVDPLRLAPLVVAAEGGLGGSVRVRVRVRGGVRVRGRLRLRDRVRGRGRVRVRVVAAEGSLHLGDIGRYGEIGGDMGRYGEIWGGGLHLGGGGVLGRALLGEALG